MAKSIPELIVEDLEKALKAINVAGGYPITLSAVERRKEPQNIKDDWKCVIGVGEPTQNPDPAWPLQSWTLHFDVGVWVPTNEASEVDPDVALLQAWASVVRALMVDTNRSGLARGQGTRCEAPVLGTDGIVVPVSVETRWLYNDMTKSG